jgi:hypothetical protein
LVIERHLRTPKAFRVQFLRAAAELGELESDREFGKLDVSDRQFCRWLDGARPRPYACRVLEHMFGLPVENLLRPVVLADSPPVPTAGRRFGDLLRTLREGRGLSLRRLGRLVHYSHGYLWDLESGSKPPQRAVVAALDAALHADGRLLAAAAEDPAWHGDDAPPADGSAVLPVSAAGPAVGVPIEVRVLVAGGVPSAVDALGVVVVDAGSVRVVVGAVDPDAAEANASGDSARVYSLTAARQRRSRRVE